MHNIIYLKNKQIDKTKWDTCIATASNGLIYGYSYYLDAMSKHWDGLVLNNYKAVMPITWNRKYGIYYLYQPFFTASLGVFGNNLSAEIVKQFLESIPVKYKYWDIYLNSGNLFTLPTFKFYQKSNYVLNLNNNYEKLTAAFSQNHIRNIKRAIKSGCTIHKNIPVIEVIRLAKKQHFSSITNADYKNFQKLYEYLHSQKQATTYGVYNSKKELISSCVYFLSHNRAYYILVGNHPAGRTSGASHFLINTFIHDHANQNLLLDFEGSEINSLAEFYRKFGAKEEKYAAIKLNKLSPLLKLLRK